MSRTIHTFLPLQGDPGEAVETFLDDSGQWLPDARHTGPDTWELSVGFARVERSVEVRVGAPWRVGQTWWRSWSWVPLSGLHDPIAVERLLPVLDAELGLVVDPSGRSTLALDGRYHAPGGRVGEALDAVALGRVAQLTLDRLLGSIGTLLTTPAPAQHPPA